MAKKNIQFFQKPSYEINDKKKEIKTMNSEVSHLKDRKYV